MEPDFWHERWNAGQIAFHQASVHPRLIRHWPELKLAPASRVFVPLCGKSLDLNWLSGLGFEVTGVELSESAIESFCAEGGVPARRRTLASFDLYEAQGLRLFRGDFFALTAADVGNTAAVYDRAALISWRPDLRHRYVQHMAELTSRGTQTLLITMEYPAGQAQGPPFAVSEADVDDLYSATHSIRLLDRYDILPDEPRFRARGVSSLQEACYLLARL